MSTFISNIRPMTRADLEQVFQIEQAAHAFPWTLGILQDCLRVGYECWVLTQDKQAIAYGIMQVAVGECHILNISVSSKFQRQGYGRKLLDKLLTLAKAKNAEMALLEVRRSNTAAIALYEELGFNEIGVRKDYYPTAKGKEDAIMFALDLSVI